MVFDDQAIANALKNKVIMIQMLQHLTQLPIQVKEQVKVEVEVVIKTQVM
jgi:hypothetical protein